MREVVQRRWLDRRAGWIFGPDVFRLEQTRTTNARICHVTHVWHVLTNNDYQAQSTCHMSLTVGRSQCLNHDWLDHAHSFASKMMSHQTLYNLANYLGALAMITVVAYHFVAVNARYLAKNGASSWIHRGFYKWLRIACVQYVADVRFSLCLSAKTCVFKLPLH